MDEESGKKPDAGKPDVKDAGDDGGIRPDGGGNGNGKPEGYASVTFYVDDTFNQTYLDEDTDRMYWKGSMLYDEASNTITLDPAWANEVGPYPGLYDDGPRSAGGHEPEGAKKGDHVFSIEVWVKADAEADLMFEYGLMNAFGYWIWMGPNGSFTVPAGSTETIRAEGIKFDKFGTYDMKLTVNMAGLHPDFAGVAYEKVFLKSSANSWTPVQLLDDGEKGDEAAGDGIYTYLHLQNLGPHDGGLYLGQHVQFVFVFNCENCLEYKVLGNAATEGVTAQTNTGETGAWIDEEIFLEKESRGKAENTTIEVGPEGVAFPPEIIFIEPDRSPTTGGVKVVVTGRNFAVGASVFFGEAEAGGVSFRSDEEITCITPPHAEGTVDVVVENHDGQRSESYPYFTYEESVGPSIESVEPSKGPVAGGTSVTINGAGFLEGDVKVSFGGVDATEVARQNQGQITCKTPPHAAGSVTVKVKNPDGSEAEKTGAFTYELVGVDWCKLQWPPQIEAVEGSLSGDIFGQVWEPGLTEGQGQVGGILAQVGYGNRNSNPTAGGWEWFDADFNTDVGNNDEYVGGFSVPTTGIYDYAFRFKLASGGDYMYCDTDGSDNGFDQSKAGKMTVEGTPPPDKPRIEAVEPADGIMAGGTQVLVTGLNFKNGLSLKFGGVEASVSEVSGDGAFIAAVTPPHAGAGKVTVKVENPGGQFDEMMNGFTYTGTSSNVWWCNLQWPKTISISEGDETETIWGRVYMGDVTGPAGSHAGLSGNVGYGPRGSNPGQNPDWIWFPASYNSSCSDCGENDEHGGKFKVQSEGEYDFAYRFSEDGGLNFLYCDAGNNNGTDGSGGGAGPYNPAEAGQLSVH